jgi:Holliday junction resolvasome RuvABC endonuclease subunit
MVAALLQLSGKMAADAADALAAAICHLHHEPWRLRMDQAAPDCSSPRRRRIL